MISHAETYHPYEPFAVADLALPVDLEAQLYAALDGDCQHDVSRRLAGAITAKIREHGVDTDTGEWLGAWSAEAIVRDVLDSQRQYTVQIQAGNAGGTIWQAMHPAENAIGDTAEAVARDVLANQNILDEGGVWRIVVWPGLDADTGLTPLHVLS